MSLTTAFHLDRGIPLSLYVFKMSDLQNLLLQYRTVSVTEREKGTYFEELIRTYFRYEATYADLYSEVWFYADKNKRAKQLENYLTYDDSLSWQYSQNLNDEWFISVNGGVSSEPKTLLQAKELKENAPNADIQILHSTFRDDRNAEWKFFYIRQATKDAKKDSATGLVIAGFFLNLISLAIFPPAFGLAGFICGIFAMAKSKYCWRIVCSRALYNLWGDWNVFWCRDLVISVEKAK
jgi:hypothetical protein